MCAVTELLRVHGTDHHTDASCALLTTSIADERESEREREREREKKRPRQRLVREKFTAVEMQTGSTDGETGHETTRAR